MLKVNTKKLKLIVLFLFLILLLNTKFLENINNIYLKNFESRITETYGFCGNESIGYLNYLKKNYNFKSNPIIINYVHTPNVSWAITNPLLINKKPDNIITLNYPGKNWEINFTKEDANSFTINNLSFYSDKINKISNIKIILTEGFSDNISMDLFSEINFGKRKFIKTFHKNQNASNKELVFNINLEIKEIYPSNNNVNFKVNNLENRKIKKINFFAENKYNLDEYHILDKHEKCFLIKK